ncbi:MAG: orotate phosphoribosyltransferase [Oligoflexia bacterium]|nr:orotate phosphoribosyltransferase [Oligoflexia bacterium]
MRSVRHGQFVLASGKSSDFYVDARMTTLHAEGAATIAALVLDRLQPQVVGVGGPVTGADPIIGAVVAASWARGRPVDGFMVRKEPKGHGLKQWLEGRGNIPNGAAVCVIEDTVTTGGSLLRAVERIRETGLEVVQVITVVDRQEGAAECIQAAGLTLDALVTRADLTG